MVPSFNRVSSTLKGLIENEVNQGKSEINFTPYISKATLDVIGLVGENERNEIFFYILMRFIIRKNYFFRIQL